MKTDMRSLIQIVEAAEKQKLNEMRVTVWSGATINVLYNPTKVAFQNMLKRAEVLRGCISYDGTKLWLWDAYMAVHPNIMQELGLHHVDCIMYSRGRWNGPVMNAQYDAYQEAIQRLTPYVAPPSKKISDDELLAMLDELDGILDQPQPEKRA